LIDRQTGSHWRTTGRQQFTDKPQTDRQQTKNCTRSPHPQLNAQSQKRTMRLEFSGTFSRERLAFSIQEKKIRVFHAGPDKMVPKFQTHRTRSSSRSSPEPAGAAAASSENAVRLAQKMQGGPHIPVGIQL
jgi:hypothetical protein